MNRDITPPLLRQGLPWATRMAIAKYCLMLSDGIAFVFVAFAASSLHAMRPGSTVDSYTEFWLSARIVDRIQILIPILLVAIAWFWLTGHYSRRRPFWDEIRETLKILLLLALIDASVQYLTKLPFSRFWYLGVWVGALVCIPTFRVFMKLILLRLGIWQRQAVIIGTGPNAIDAAAALYSEHLMGYEVVAFADTIEGASSRKSELDHSGLSVPVVTLGPKWPDELMAPDQPTIVVALEADELERSSQLIGRLNRECNDLQVVPPLRGLPIYGARLHYFFRHELFFLVLGNNLSRRGPRLIKRVFDFVVSTILLAILLPMLAMFALWIARDGGPVLFRHERIGQGGTKFHCLKFRSMVPDAQSVLDHLLATDLKAREQWQRAFKLKHDPRITRVGRILRAHSLDELPQLWNVVKGEMSLVGPRPIVQSEIDRYGEVAEDYLLTKPGMTGLWQVSGRNDTDYGERVYLDSWYAKNWSLWIDIVILFKTIRVVLNRNGAY